MPSVWCLWLGDFFVLFTTLGLTEHALQLVHLLAQQHQHAGLLLVSAGHRGEGERAAGRRGQAWRCFALRKKVAFWCRVGGDSAASRGQGQGTMATGCVVRVREWVMGDGGTHRVLYSLAVCFSCRVSVA